jgi:hypothetical protein
MGGMIVGFDYQVFRTTPPPHELVQSARPVTGVSGEDGTEFLVIFPAAAEPTGGEAEVVAASAGAAAADAPRADATDSGDAPED